MSSLVRLNLVQFLKEVELSHSLGDGCFMENRKSNTPCVRHYNIVFNLDQLIGQERVCSGSELVRSEMHKHLPNNWLLDGIFSQRWF